MSGPLIVGIGLVYAYIAGEQALKGNLAWAIVYGGYAFGNLGMFLALPK